MSANLHDNTYIKSSENLDTKKLGLVFLKVPRPSIVMYRKLHIKVL